MIVRSRNMVSTLLTLVTLAALVSSQITFSRDWTGGKRAAAPIALDCGQFAKLCRHFLHEMKSSMVPAAPDKRRRGSDDQPALYDEE